MGRYEEIAKRTQFRNERNIESKMSFWKMKLPILIFIAVGLGFIGYTTWEDIQRDKKEKEFISHPKSVVEEDIKKGYGSIEYAREITKKIAESCPDIDYSNNNILRLEREILELNNYKKLKRGNKVKLPVYECDSKN